MKTKFSIITICLNAEDTIDKTMQSVCEQTYRNYEHIIVDGKSIDATLDKIEAYRQRYEEGALYIFSELDEGIYDAMNKGLQHVTGDFICFMNSGDTFFAKDTLEKVSNVIREHNQYELYYGGSATVWPNGEIRGQLSFFKPWKSEDVQQGRVSALMPCHQAIFASPKCFKNNLFELKYKLRAEYRWFINCVLNHISMYEVGFPVCTYLYGGTSEQLENIEKSKKEMEEVLRESGLCGKADEVEPKGTSNNRNSLLIVELSKLLALKQNNNCLERYFAKKGYVEIAIYGYGLLCNFLIAELEDTNIRIKYLIDREKKYELHDIPVYFPNSTLEEVDVTVVTVVEHFKAIYDALKEKVKCPIVSLDDILEEVWYL